MKVVKLDEQQTAALIHFLNKVQYNGLPEAQIVTAIVQQLQDAETESETTTD